MLCRDVCHYCTFARPPRRGERAFLTVDEAARDRTRRAPRPAAARRSSRSATSPSCATGPRATSSQRSASRRRAAYLAHVRGAVLRETGPAAPREPGRARRRRARRPARGLRVAGDHARDDVRPAVAARRRRTSARRTRSRPSGSTTIAPRRTAADPVHERHPDRHRRDAPRARRGAARAARPAPRHGHLQEVIVQNFRAKAGTRMAGAAEPSLDDHLWTIAVARARAAARRCRIQAPPNLSGDEFPRLLDAGIDDLGGVSPVTPDHVNPEAPWPDARAARAGARGAGLTLLPRLAVYPRFLADPERWLSDDDARPPRSRPRTALGLARRERWTTGTRPSRRPPGAAAAVRSRVGGISPAFARALERAELRELLDEDDADGAALARAAPRSSGARERGRRRRARAVPATRVTYVVMPERQLHERLLLPLRLLRVLEGQARREPARPRLPAERRRGRAPRASRPGSAAPPRSACRAASTRASPGDWYLELLPRGQGGRPRRSTCTRSRRSRSGRARPRRSGPSPTTCSGCRTRASARCPAPPPRSSTTTCGASSARTRSRPRSGSRSCGPRTASACARRRR